eukprot:gene5619-9436_t
MGNKEKGDKQNFQNVTTSFKQKDRSISEFGSEFEGSYFSDAEIKELYNLFNDACYPSKELSAETFNNVFPMFKKEFRIQQSLFQAIDEDGGGTVGFPEFIKALGIMSRGSPEEKANFTLAIVDLDNDKKIQKHELEEVCEKIVEITSKMPSIDNIIPAEQVVEKIFAQEKTENLKNKKFLYMAEDQGTSIKEAFQDLKDGNLEHIKQKYEEQKSISKEDKKEMKKAVLLNKVDDLKKKIKKETEKEITELTYDEFKARAKNAPEFTNCFGMFSLFVSDIVTPIQKKFDTSVKKFGFPSIEGNVKCGALFGEAVKYCQVQNGMVTFFEDYSHALMSEKRWFIDDSGLLAKKFNPMGEMSQAVFALTQEGKHASCAVGMNNNTKYDLDAPIVTLFSGVTSKKADLKILTKSYGTVLISATKSLGYVSGFISYRIGETKKRLIILIDVPATYIKSNHHFNCAIVDEDQDLTQDLYKHLKKDSISSGSRNWIQKRFHVKAIVGSDMDKQYNKHKLAFRIEIYDAVEAQPPEYVIDLAEASCYRKPESDYSFLLNTHQLKHKIEIAVEEPDLLPTWISAISENTKVTHVFDHPFHSFAKSYEDCPTQIFMGGKEYFDDLAENLKKAQDEILITGWFISPLFHLTRKKIYGEYVDRLDHILLERANAGCRIYVAVWDEIDAAFNLGSAFMKEHLEKLHPHIHCIRDPPSALGIYSHHQKTVVIDQQIAYVGGIDIAYNRYEENYALTDEGEDLIYPGRDYVNPMMPAKNKNIGDPLEDVYDRKRIPRMPWQDYHAKVIGEPARDVARNFIQRWIFTKDHDQPHISLRQTDYSQDEYLESGKQELKETLAKVQVLRSAAYWSTGLSGTENSIYKSQIRAIKEAKHFVYIENQFFISSCTKVENPKNRLIGTLVDRVSKAIENNEPFKAIFLCPLHSSSPLNTKTLQNLTYWQLSSMFKGPYSMLTVLQEKFPEVDVEDYVTISCLRNWGKFKSGVYCNEMIYIHSKLMIVDDRIIFCSSANVNDRSMLGDRDSEIGLRIEGNEEIEIEMGGEKFMASKLAHNLRVKAMAKFTGRSVDDKEVWDAVKFFKTWREISEHNRDIYVEVFQRTVENLESSKDALIIQQYNHVLKAKNPEKLEKLQGYVVPYPKKLFSKIYKQPDPRDMLTNFYC